MVVKLDFLHKRIESLILFFSFSELSREIDVYGEWVNVSKGASTSTTTNASLDDIQKISMEMEHTHIDSQAESSTSTPK